MARRHLSPKEFARVTGISVKTVRRRLKDGKLPAVQSGGPKTLWEIDYELYLQQFDNATAPSPEVPPDLPPNLVIESLSDRIPGPRPKWKRGEFRLNNKRGYGPKKKKH